MELLRTIREADIEPNQLKISEQYRDRYAARAVVKDDQGRVALLHASVRNYYKLPGGGVEKDEDIATALARELLEEVGTEAEVTGEIGRVEEWRTKGDEGLHQISDAYTARTIGTIGQPDFTESEIAEGFSVVWAHDVTDAIQKVESALDSTDASVRFMALRDVTILHRAKEL